MPFHVLLQLASLHLKNPFIAKKLLVVVAHAEEVLNRVL